MRIQKCFYSCNAKNRLPTHLSHYIASGWILYTFQNTNYSSCAYVHLQYLSSNENEVFINLTRINCDILPSCYFNTKFKHKIKWLICSFIRETWKQVEELCVNRKCLFCCKKLRPYFERAQFCISSKVCGFSLSNRRLNNQPT